MSLILVMKGALRDSDVTIYGGERAAHALGLPPAPETKFEYGLKALTLEIVSGLEEAIDHIHAYGSSHTESIVTGQIYTLHAIEDHPPLPPPPPPLFRRTH